jgi:hypothetical protein
MNLNELTSISNDLQLQVQGPNSSGIFRNRAAHEVLSAG